MRIGDYEVHAELGRGGMGVVFYAVSPSGADVAIKVLNKTATSAALARFDRERRLQSSLGEADGFVPLLDAGEAREGPFLVMPLVPGGTLRARFKKGPLSVEDTVALGVVLGRSLGRAHERGIIHRDLKPENVLFTAAGRPLIADLGLGKHFAGDSPGASQSVSLSQTGEIMGTAGYMAPEQMNDAKAVGPEADVFSLGAMLYECLAGQPAFQSDSVHGVLAKVAQGSVEPLRQKRRDVPRWLVSVIERALAPDSRRRYVDGEALARALEAAVGEPGASGGLRRGVAAAGVVLLVAAAGVGWKLSGRQGPKVVDAAEPPPPSPGTQPSAPPAAPNAAGPSNVPVLAIPGTWGAVHGVAISPQGDLLAAACADHKVRTFSPIGGALVGTRDGFNEEASSVVFSPKGDLIGAGSLDWVAAYWSRAPGAEPRALLNSDRVNAVAFSPDGYLFGAAGHDGVVRLTRLKGGSELGSNVVIRSDGSVHAIAFSADGGRVVTGGDDHKAHIWSVSDGKPLGIFPGHDEAIRALACSPRGDTAASGSDDKTARVWSLRDSRELLRLEDHDGPVLSVAFSPSGAVLLTGSRDGKLRFWSTRDGARIATLDAHKGGVESAVFSAKGDLVVSGGADETVKVWRAPAEPNPPR